MTKTQVQQVLVVALLLVFLWVWTQTRSAERKAAPAIPAAPASGAAAELPGESPSSNQSSPEAPSVARDFFRLPSLLKDLFHQKELEKEASERSRSGTQTPAQAAPPPSLELQGVLWGPKPMAIINRQVLTVGDRMAGAEIVSISREGVLVLYGGQEIQLALPPMRQSSSEGQQPGQF